MVLRNGSFISFTDSDSNVVLLNVQSIVYLECDYNKIYISTSDYEWVLYYTPELYDSFINAICRY